MKMQQFCAKAVAAMVLLILGGSDVTEAAVTFNAQNRPTGVSGLAIAGKTYNATIHYGTSFDALFGSFTAPSPEPAFWGNNSGALAAVAALAQAVNATNVDPTINTLFVVPAKGGTWFLGDYVDGYSVEFELGDTVYSHSGPLEGVRLDPHVAADFGLTSLIAVPEPSSASLLAIGGAAAAAMRRRLRSY